MVQAGLAPGQQLLGISDPVRYTEVWPLKDNASLRYVRDSVRMRRSPTMTLVLSPQPLPEWEAAVDARTAAASAAAGSGAGGAAVLEADEAAASGSSMDGAEGGLLEAIGGLPALRTRSPLAGWRSMQGNSGALCRVRSHHHSVPVCVMSSLWRPRHSSRSSPGRNGGYCQVPSRYAPRPAALQLRLWTWRISSLLATPARPPLWGAAWRRPAWRNSGRCRRCKRGSGAGRTTSARWVHPRVPWWATWSSLVFG